MFCLVNASKSIKLALMTSVALAAIGLGGCNNDVKTENEALKAQISQTQTERDQNKQLLDQSEAQKNELRAQNEELMRTKASMQAQPQPMDSGTGGGGGGGGQTATRKQANRDVVIQVAGDVAFAPGQAVLSAAGKKELNTIASTLKSKYPKNQLRVEGYTDSDPVRKSSFGSNEALSRARAVAVEKYLASKGVSASRMTAVGRGSANAKSSKAASRRVEIHVLGG